MKYKVIAYVYFGGVETVKSFENEKEAQNFACKLQNNLDPYTSFEVICE